MRILIADDHALVRDALAMSVAKAFPEAGLKQCANFTLAAAEPGPFDLIISDLGMPGATPVEGIRQIKAAHPAARLVVLTGQEDDALLLEIMAIGIEGFLTKSTDSGIITAALQLILAGGTYIPPRLMELTKDTLLSELPLQKSPLPAPAEVEFGRLSQRHLEVLTLLVAGAPNKQIARELSISPATVKTHVAHILASLGAANRTEAAMRARAAGLI